MTATIESLVDLAIINHANVFVQRIADDLYEVTARTVEGQLVAVTTAARIDADKAASLAHAAHRAAFRADEFSTATRTAYARYRRIAGVFIAIVNCPR